MLCLKAKVLEHDIVDMYLPTNFKGSLARHLLRGGRERAVMSRSSSVGDGSGTSEMEDFRRSSSSSDKMCKRKMSHYKSQLENDIREMERKLREEIDLHVAYASAVENTAAPISNFATQLPDKSKQLLENVASLEITCLKLEEELVTLHFQLSQERNERRLVEYHLRREMSSFPSSLPDCPTHQDELDADPCWGDAQESDIGTQLPQSDVLKESKKNFDSKDLSIQPNKLSEEMLRCMRNIFMCLADSSKNSSKLASTDGITSPRSPNGFLSSSSLSSLSDSSWKPSLTRSPSTELHTETSATDNSFDPFRLHGKVEWNDIGRYSSAVEVSSLSVGKKQLEYAAEALKCFRLMVEKLGKVNPAIMSHNEKLAFWINLYNALVMHAYLAYGVPRSDIKFFSLMQKVSYTVGGHLFSAVDIEYVLLKMKPPSHRPQIQALVLAIHKFKLSEEQKAYGIDNPDPLVAFALSSGSYSSPAVKVFTPDNVVEELRNSLRDYIRASVGLSKKGRLLVPKLLHSYAKGIVEDSLLADWICRFGSPEQAAAVRDCISQRKHRLLGARSFVIVPFDSRFRYLFLLERETHKTPVSD